MTRRKTGIFRSVVLSGGKQQRVALCRALADRSRVFHAHARVNQARLNSDLHARMQPVDTG